MAHGATWAELACSSVPARPPGPCSRRGPGDLTPRASLAAHARRRQTHNVKLLCGAPTSESGARHMAASNPTPGGPPAGPCLTRPHGAHDGTAAPQHRLVDGLLVLGELAVGRKGARDVRSEAVILTAHVKQAVGREGVRPLGCSGTPCPSLSSLPALKGSVRGLSPNRVTLWLVRAAAGGLLPQCLLTVREQQRNPARPGRPLTPEQTDPVHTPALQHLCCPGHWMLGCGDSLGE